MKLKPRSSGISERERRAQRRPDRSRQTTSSSSATGQTRGRTPVCSCRFVADARPRQRPERAQQEGASSTHQYAGSQSSSGILMPRLDRNTPGNGWNDCRGAGSPCSAVYQNSSCSSTGMSRTTST